ncbi:MAG: hypothetical protein ABH874_05595 [Methanobacteriota archaeon]
MVTFEELCWTSFILTMYSPDEEEIFLDEHKLFRDKLRNNPREITDDDVQKTLIKGFLNKWKCRGKNNSESAKAIKNCIDELKPQFQRLEGKSIEYELLADLEPIVIEIYDKIRKSLKDYRFGPTAISKLLHIINPNLFVMWDGNIRDKYAEKNSKIGDSGEGYFTFLEEMQKIAKEIREDFRRTKSKPSATGTDVASYLDEKLSLLMKDNQSCKTSLARYIDMHNWLVITMRGRKPILPLGWHPAMD